MRILIDLPARTVGLSEPDAFDGFSVEVTGKGTPEYLGEVVGEAGLGRIDPDGTHVLVDPQGLRTLAGAAVTPQWEASLEGMCAYAASKGWIADDGAIQAHIEWRG
jgi:hypothetical protein